MNTDKIKTLSKKAVAKIPVGHWIEVTGLDSPVTVVLYLESAQTYTPGTFSLRTFNPANGALNWQVTNDQVVRDLGPARVPGDDYLVRQRDTLLAALDVANAALDMLEYAREGHIKRYPDEDQATAALNTCLKAANDVKLNINTGQG